MNRSLCHNRLRPLLLLAALAALAVTGVWPISCMSAETPAGKAIAPAATLAQTAPLPDRQEVIRYAAVAGEGTWKKATTTPDNLSSRELFTYALALCEAKQSPERLQTLFEVAARMQDRDPQSRGYGNFRWSWVNPTVMDYNAVEFCMQAGALIWMRHRDSLTPAARAGLRETLDFAVEGCLRHRVRPGYTNIALMNAQNLILLGESLDLPKAADDGYTRLDNIVMNTWQSGIAEYGSPTYYGVDLDCLVMIEAFAKRERGLAQARALLDLFWTDIAANYFPPSERLGGTHSRDYDYVRGRGSLDTHFWMAGWIGGKPRGGIGAIFPALGRWQPPAALLQMSRTRFPRLVRQMWGAAANQTRTQLVLPDVTLGSAGANYHNMDLPLTVDLPGPPDFPRCYFMPDARHDPYGKEKIKEGTGPHSKTLHLRPFWLAAQNRTDALGVALYRDEDMTKAGATLESHFVVPRDLDAFWVGDRRVDMKAGPPATFPLRDGEALVLRKGAAAVGVRVVWARDVAGKPATAALVDDANAFGVVRLTVVHHEGKEPAATVVGAGAAFWVRVGSGLATDEAFDAWRRQFAAAKVDVTQDAKTLALKVAGVSGPVAATMNYPDGSRATTEPAPARTVLELDGEDVGARMLQNLEPVKSERAAQANIPTVPLTAGKGTYIEAESGSAFKPMVAAEDAAASGGKFVWMPGEPGGKGGGDGRIAWNLTVPAAGPYYVWGRVLSPTPEDDSFYVATSSAAAPQPAVVEWHLGTRPAWTWVPLLAPGTKTPLALEWPKGEVRLELRGREDGAKIDRLFITDKAEEKPE